MFIIAVKCLTIFWLSFATAGATPPGTAVSGRASGGHVRSAAPRSRPYNRPRRTIIAAINEGDNRAYL